MKTKTLLHKILYVVAAFVLSLFVVCEYTFSKAVNANAATESKYTSVLDDLHKDFSFDESDYPAKDNDNSLSVIQIAESVDGELFIYVYQPSDNIKDLTATSINISTEIEDGLNPLNYKLTLLSTDGVFDKYKVEAFSVKKVALRYYYIVSISRAFDNTIDGVLYDDNTISEVAYPVGLLWSATTLNNKVGYMVDSVDYIQVTEKHVGFIRYMDFLALTGYTYTDSHYVAFKTNKPIDTLLEATISYRYETYWNVSHSSFLHALNNKESATANVVTKTLLAEEVFEDNNWFPFMDDYKYNRIQTTEAFLKNESEEMLDETEKALENTDWILRFYESGYTSSLYTGCGTDMFPCTNTVNSYTVVKDVTMLRLKYVYEGDAYNLGVVDNKTSGDTVPDNDNWNKIEDDDWPDWVYLLIYGVLGILGIGALIAIGVFGKPLFKLMWKVLCVPFKLLSKLFKALGKLFRGKK